jgi:hypothetical protein
MDNDIPKIKEGKNLRGEPINAIDTVEHSGASSRGLALALGFFPLVTAIGLWIGSLDQFDLSRMTDIGLISILPVSYILAMVFLTVGFAISLQLRDAKEPIFFLYLVVLIWFIHGTPQLLYGTLRYSWAWKHVAIVDYIQRHGTVDPTISYLNIYHNWPGFFTLNTFITELAGIPSAIEYAGWAPVFFNILDFGALLLIYRTFTKDRRLVWLSAWFFFLANWIGQDYFSPQALTYFLYLVVIGICLMAFRDTTMPSREAVLRFLKLDRYPALHDPNLHAPQHTHQIAAAGQPYQRVGLAFISILAITAIASSHQLTPLMMLAALAGLVLLRCCQVRSLPILMFTITVSWIIFLAVGYLHGSILLIVQSLQDLLVDFHSNIQNLEVSSPGQILVANMDRGLTALVGILGIFGAMRRFRLGKWDLPAIVLSITPIPLLAIPYGSEILFRIYFFILPTLAFFAAGIFFPASRTGKSIFTTMVVILTSFVMLVGLGFAYYGKEKINYFPQQEVDAANYIADHAQPGALIYSATWDWPLQIRNYENYQYESISNFDANYKAEILNDPVGVIALEMSHFSSGYLIISNSQKAEANMTGILPAGSLDRIQNALVKSPVFRVVYQNPDAIVFTLANSNGGG